MSGLSGGRGPALRRAPSDPTGIGNGVINGLGRHHFRDQNARGTEVQQAPDHVGVSGVGNTQLHVDAQLFGSTAIVDQRLLGKRCVLPIDPDVVVRTG